LKIGIIEPNLLGHPEVHLKAIVAAAAKRGWAVKVYTSRQSFTDARFRLIEQAADGSLDVLCTPPHPTLAATGAASLFWNQFRSWWWFAKAYREAVRPDAPDFIYVINLDSFDKAAAVLGSPFGRTPFGGMLMAARFHHRRAGVLSRGSHCDPVYRGLFAWLLRMPSLRVVTTIDPFLIPAWAKSASANSQKVSFVPDIGDLPATSLTKSDARRELGLEENGFVLLVYGGIKSEKGVEQLLMALDGEKWPAGLQVLLVGNPADDMREFLASERVSSLRQARKVITRLGYSDEGLTAAAFRSASAAWLGYVGHDGSSGVLCQAVEAGLPVIACRNGLIGFYTRSHGIGEIVNVHDPTEVAAIVHRLASTPALLELYAANAARLRGTHSPKAFGEAICDAISSRLDRALGTRSLVACGVPCGKQG
jgi:glycosyltransferase involved in cell wall biosynthesis